ncbi:hypothetical protein GCM10010912_23220 [Paenibacillus albidus]|uniref:HTH cro/C1-type domain-containing protein n=1 Tax=Paenibacillus albidus TaxID=2041023 RepID=A0A917FGL0_9BACL|nr:helix-turn-helix transcriptional regulator [Paenibacillus albidus]GGF77508.1 hypothetical protein GCM10010912_23220 [Paenibacillus albidus]
MKELIAKRLIQLRGEASREVTAKAIGISISALQMYENAQRVPKDEIKVKVAAHFKQSVQSIFFDQEPHETCFLDEQSATKEVV